MRRRATMTLYVVQTIIEGGNYERLKGQVSRKGLPKDFETTKCSEFVATFINAHEGGIY